MPISPLKWKFIFNCMALSYWRPWLTAESYWLEMTIPPQLGHEPIRVLAGKFHHHKKYYLRHFFYIKKKYTHVIREPFDLSNNPNSASRNINM